MNRVNAVPSCPRSLGCHGKRRDASTLRLSIMRACAPPAHARSPDRALPLAPISAQPRSRAAAQPRIRSPRSAHRAGDAGAVHAVHADAGRAGACPDRGGPRWIETDRGRRMAAWLWEGAAWPPGASRQPRRWNPAVSAARGPPRVCAVRCAPGLSVPPVMLRGCLGPALCAPFARVWPWRRGRAGGAARGVASRRACAWLRHASRTSRLGDRWAPCCPRSPSVALGRRSGCGGVAARRVELSSESRCGRQALPRLPTGPASVQSSPGRSAGSGQSRGSEVRGQWPVDGAGALCIASSGQRSGTRRRRPALHHARARRYHAQCSARNELRSP